MGRLVDVVGYVNLVVFTALALVALREWRRRPGRAAPWAALAFGTLAIVVVVGSLLPEDTATPAERVVERAVIVLLVLFPYLLYRFTTAFRPPSRRLERRLAAMTATVLVATLALPDVPEFGESQPVWFLAYLVAFLTHWSVLSVAVALRLWRAGVGQPTVSRRRMRLLSAAAAALTVGVVLSAVATGDDSPLRLATQLVALASAVGFLLALAPPWLVRAAWRRPEQARLQKAIGHLMGATTEAEVAEQVLEPVVEMVGARAAVLLAGGGRPIGAYGLSDDACRRLEREDPSAVAEGEVQRVDAGAATLVLWTTPYAPFFGGEELSLLRALGDLTGLALDRTRLFAQERTARAALERADALKSSFVALAAHELRTPVAAVHGIAETLHRLAGDLSENRRTELRRMLYTQTTRLRLLVDQLLDLSRLDADAISIEPRRLRVRERVEELVADVAGAAPAPVLVDVAPDLEAPVDPDAFDRIVANLVANAVRYGSAPIVVRAELLDRHFRLTVEDRGPGVPTELVPQLFERFTRGNEARSRGIGTGLGLAIARSYAQAHDGELLYEPADPHGACFQLVLPAG